jgi:hypothetical protein
MSVEKAMKTIGFEAEGPAVTSAMVGEGNAAALAVARSSDRDADPQTAPGAADEVRLASAVKAMEVRGESYAPAKPPQQSRACILL